MNRVHLAEPDLHLPPCALPRPHQVVVWYTDSMRREGTLLGHGPGARPFVRTENGFTQCLDSFDQIRRKDSADQGDPVWKRLSPRSLIVAPFPPEKARFFDLLQQRIPPGPTYFELVEEIWHRGFEVFLVGGTVRDVLAGVESKDIDLMTTMPLARALPLLTSMYRREPSVDETRGFVRLGGRPGSGDPFIDLKTCIYSDPGTPQAVFGASLDRDTQHRDFACNSVYYDPINCTLIDPTGRGIAGAADRVLEVSCNHELRPAFYRGQIAIRFFKFLARGFSYPDEVRIVIEAHYIPALEAMHTSNVISYTRTQVLSKLSTDDRSASLERFKDSMRDFGAEQLWITRFQPVVAEILES